MVVYQVIQSDDCGIWDRPEGAKVKSVFSPWPIF